MLLADYTSTRDNNFNLIRFIAATLVLFSHSFVLASGRRDDEPLRGALGISWGEIAVDTFFVTSGLLITASFFHRKSLIAFIWARIVRIMPALIVAVFFCVCVVGAYFTTAPLAEYFTEKQTLKFIIKNSILLNGLTYELPQVFEHIPYPNAVNGSLWTLPYEVKMYACMMCLGLLVNHFGKSWTVATVKLFYITIALVALVLDITQGGIEGGAVFAHLFSMFFVGVAFYICREHIRLSFPVFVVLLVAVLLSALDREVFYIVYVLSIAYLVFYVAYIPAGKIRAFNKVGDYSYGMYIHAFPVQQSVAALIPNISVAMMVLISFVITLLLAFLSWHLLEKKALQMKGSYVHIENVLGKITKKASR